MTVFPIQLLGQGLTPDHITSLTQKAIGLDKVRDKVKILLRDPACSIWILVQGLCTVVLALQLFQRAITPLEVILQPPEERRLAS